MPDFYVRMLGALREQMTADLSRSDVIKPLQAVLWVLALLLVGALFAKAAPWLQIGLFVLICFDLLMIACAYAFFAKSDSSALRSETYSLKKLAIEQGMLGDDIAGLFGAEEVKSKTDETSTKTIEHKP